MKDNQLQETEENVKNTSHRLNDNDLENELFLNCSYF